LWSDEIFYTFTASPKNRGQNNSISVLVTLIEILPIHGRNRMYNLNSFNPAIYALQPACKGIFLNITLAVAVGYIAKQCFIALATTM